MDRNFGQESRMQDSWFDWKLIKVIIRDVLFSLDDDNVLDSDSDVDGEYSTEAPQASKKEQAMAFF